MMAARKNRDRHVVGAPKGFSLGNCISSTTCWNFDWLRWFSFSQNSELLIIRMDDAELQLYLHKSCKSFIRLEKLVKGGKSNRRRIESLCFLIVQSAYGDGFHQRMINTAFERGKAEGIEEIRTGLKTLLGI